MFAQEPEEAIKILSGSHDESFLVLKIFFLLYAGKPPLGLFFYYPVAA